MLRRCGGVLLMPHSSLIYAQSKACLPMPNLKACVYVVWAYVFQVHLIKQAAALSRFLHSPRSTISHCVICLRHVTTYLPNCMLMLTLLYWANTILEQVRVFAAYSLWRLMPWQGPRPSFTGCWRTPRSTKQGTLVAPAVSPRDHAPAV